nr:diphthine synthase [Candidatus Bathyarchaeota archaeon]
MLWFVGLGISNSKSIPLEAVEVLKKADIVYLEQFTSPISKSELAKIKSM